MPGFFQTPPSQQAPSHEAAPAAGPAGSRWGNLTDALDLLRRRGVPGLGSLLGSSTTTAVPRADPTPQAFSHRSESLSSRTPPIPAAAQQPSQGHRLSGPAPHATPSVVTLRTGPPVGHLAAADPQASSATSTVPRTDQTQQQRVQALLQQVRARAQAASAPPSVAAPRSALKYPSQTDSSSTALGHPDRKALGFPAQNRAVPPSLADSETPKAGSSATQAAGVPARRRQQDSSVDAGSVASLDTASIVSWVDSLRVSKKQASSATGASQASTVSRRREAPSKASTVGSSAGLTKRPYQLLYHRRVTRDAASSSSGRRKPFEPKIPTLKADVEAAEVLDWADTAADALFDSRHPGEDWADLARRGLNSVGKAWEREQDQAGTLPSGWVEWVHALAQRFAGEDLSLTYRRDFSRLKRGPEEDLDTFLTRFLELWGKVKSTESMVGVDPVSGEQHLIRTMDSGEYACLLAEKNYQDPEQAVEKVRAWLVRAKRVKGVSGVDPSRFLASSRIPMDIRQEQANPAGRSHSRDSDRYGDKDKDKDRGKDRVREQPPPAKATTTEEQIKAIRREMDRLRNMDKLAGSTTDPLTFLSRAEKERLLGQRPSESSSGGGHPQVNALGACFGCNQPGHVAAQCPTTKTTCYSCGKTGHMAKNCPNPKQKDPLPKCPQGGCNLFYKYKLKSACVRPQMDRPEAERDFRICKWNNVHPGINAQGELLK